MFSQKKFVYYDTRFHQGVYSLIPCIQHNWHHCEQQDIMKTNMVIRCDVLVGHSNRLWASTADNCHTLLLHRHNLRVAETLIKCITLWYLYFLCHPESTNMYFHNISLTPITSDAAFHVHLVIPCASGSLMFTLNQVGLIASTIHVW